MLLAILRFLISFSSAAVRFFTGVPGKAVLVVSALGAVVVECSAFVGSLRSFFTDAGEALTYSFSQLTSGLDDIVVFPLLKYCFSLDVLARLVGAAVTFFVLVVSFLFVTFLHLVLLYFGLKFGYNVYKYLLTVASNGFAKG